MMLQFALEQNWGDVGWALWQAQTIADIRAAFRNILNPQCHLLEPFTRDQTRNATASKVRTARATLSKLTQRHRERYAQLQNAFHEYKRAAQASSVETDPVKWVKLERICSNLAREHQEIEALEGKIRVERDSLALELAECEAYVAQSEILRFIQSNRRRFTPLNLARAMAGLPIVTARVSCENCTEHGIVPAPGLAFQIFDTIQRVIKEPVRDLACVIDATRRHLLKCANNESPHTAVLRENWYFLELAIRSEVCHLSAPPGSLPYRIFSEYMATSTRHDAADGTLAIANRLNSDDESPSQE
jgi:hypothetical protein